METGEYDNMCVQLITQFSRVGAITSNLWAQQHDGGFVGHYSHFTTYNTQSGHVRNQPDFTKHEQTMKRKLISQYLIERLYIHGMFKPPWAPKWVLTLILT